MWTCFQHIVIGCLSLSLFFCCLSFKARGPSHMLKVRSHLLYKQNTSRGNRSLVSTNVYWRERVQWYHVLTARNVNTTPETLLKTSYPIPTQVLSEIVYLINRFQIPLRKSPTDTNCRPNKTRSDAFYLPHRTPSHHQLLLTVPSHQPLAGFL